MAKRPTQQAKVVAYLAAHSGSDLPTNAKIAQRLGVSERTVYLAKQKAMLGHMHNTVYDLVMSGGLAEVTVKDERVQNVTVTAKY